MLLNPQLLHTMLDNWASILHDIFLCGLKPLLAYELHEERAIYRSPLINHSQPHFFMNAVHHIHWLTSALLLLRVLQKIKHEPMNFIPITHTGHESLTEDALENLKR